MSSEGERQRKERHWLKDTREAIEKIQTHPKFPEGKEAFDSDEHYRVWVLFHMERVGECVSNLRRDFNYDEKHPDIDWKGTQGMRRKIVHQYWETDYDKVWQGIEYLPKIKDKIEKIVNDKTREPDRKPDRPQRPKLDDVLKFKKKDEGRDRDDDLTR